MPWRTSGRRRPTTSPAQPGLSAAGRLVRGLAWLLALAALTALGACGLKTPPRPVSEVLPAPDAVRAWQREGDLIVAWAPPSKGRQDKYGGLRGYEVWLQARPLLCLECPPETPQRVRLAANDPALHAEAGLVFYRRTLGAQVGQVRVRVSTRFGVGQGPASAAVGVERSGVIPAPVLHWRGAGGSSAKGARSVQFYWQPVQERIVQEIGTDAVPREQVQNYRANLYRRVPPAAWPLLPLNSAPLTAPHWIVPPLEARFPAGATREEYRLRLVDQFGNEGPPSATAQVPLAGRQP